MKKIFFVFALGLSIFSSAQKHWLNVKEAVTRMRDTVSLNPEFLNGLDWVPGTYSYYHYGKKDRQPCLVFNELNSVKSDTLTLQEINQAISIYANTVIMNPNAAIALKGFPRIHSWRDEQRFRFIHGENIYLYHIKDRFVTLENRLDSGADHMDIHPETGNIALLRGNNLFIKGRGAAQNVDTSSGDGIVYGQAVHRNEFGINKGIFWSPEGGKVAFYRMDESMVTEYPVYVLEDMPATGHEIRYPFAGSKSHHVKVGVYDLKKNKTLYLNTGEPAEQYLTNIAWSPDEKHIYIAVVNREQNRMSLREYDAATGENTGTLFVEENPRYVEPESPMVFVPGKRDQFIWLSERDGFNHLYLYNTEGKLIRQLTSGKWVVTQFLSFDKKGKTAYFMGTRDGDLNNNLYSVDLSNGQIRAVSDAPGQHRSSGTYDGKYWIDIYSSYNVPAITRIVDENGKETLLLKKSANPLADYLLGETSVFSIPSRDGEAQLYCRLIKPVGFDSTKKYPVVVYLYGGPHLQLIKNTWLYGADLWMNYMAQQGYVVFSIDNRGSANRGFAFESAVHRQLGTLEIQDQLAGVDYLKKQSFVDADRMGIFGWSFGGFMTTGMMTRAAGTFKAGVAGGPVIDWAMYEVMYTERYMDTPEENPEGYKTANLLHYADKLQGKLLLIHGTSDDVVLWQHSLLYLKKCIEKGVQVDYFVYPGHPHNVIGKDRVHLYQKVTDYLRQHLEK